MIRTATAIKTSRTKRGVLREIFFSQVGKSKRRGHIPPAYTREELYDWGIAQQQYHDLHDAWIQADYFIWLKPSCDRLDDSKPYTLNNLQIITWQENKDKEDTKVKLGQSVRKLMSVRQLTLTGTLVAIFYSMAEAERQTGVKMRDISAVCSDKNRQKTAGGFKWEKC